MTSSMDCPTPESQRNLWFAHLVCESLSQQWQRISNKVELVWSDALAAVGCNGQGISLSIDAKELQVEEAVSESTL